MWTLNDTKSVYGNTADTYEGEEGNWKEDETFWVRSENDAIGVNRGRDNRRSEGQCRKKFWRKRKGEEDEQGLTPVFRRKKARAEQKQVVDAQEGKGTSPAFSILGGLRLNSKKKKKDL